MSKRDFIVLLGPDYAGKSTLLATLAQEGLVRVVSYDTQYTKTEFPMVAHLLKTWVPEVFERRGTAYSREFTLSLLQAIVLHIRDQTQRFAGDGTVLVDSYYYKLLAKGVLLGLVDPDTARYWRSFSAPTRVVFLDVHPRCAWHRAGCGAEVHAFERYSEATWESFTRFQGDLRAAMLHEVRDLPVEMIDGGSDRATVLQRLRETLRPLSSSRGSCRAAAAHDHHDQSGSEQTSR